MQLNGEITTLQNVFSEKTRSNAVAALSRIEEALKESEHNEQLMREALEAMSAYDSTYANITMPEGIRRLRERIDEQSREMSMQRSLLDKDDAVITACKVALLAEVTADHRWHTPEENCPHARCVALNKIETVRGA